MYTGAVSLGLYIHYPYCRRVCPFCEFVVHRRGREAVAADQRYFKALGSELSRARHRFGDLPLHSLYFGGGTPALAEIDLVENLLEQIHRQFNTRELKEVTLEADPLTVDLPKLAKFKELGFHRLSLGIQSFDDHLLEILGRGYAGKDVFNLLEMCQHLGFAKLSADLMYGIPDQTMEVWQSDLSRLASLSNLQHISLYNLSVEPKGNFQRRINKLGKVLPTDELQVTMHETAIDLLASRGFKQYEITAWARPGYEAIHNQGYWLGTPYLGIGVSACSYHPGERGGDRAVNGKGQAPSRWENERSLKVYLEKVEQGESPIADEEVLTAAQVAQEFVMLRLRRRAGIGRQEWEGFLKSAPRSFAAVTQRFLTSGHLIWEEESLTFSRTGMMVSNEILSEFCLTDQEAD